jgi:DnaJ-class molecular chaperone
MPTITRTCVECGGTGAVPYAPPPPAQPVPLTCPTCDGLGYLTFGQMDDEILNDIKEKVDEIMEKLNEWKKP